MKYFSNENFQVYGSYLLPLNAQFNALFNLVRECFMLSMHHHDMTAMFVLIHLPFWPILKV